jgi:hypothetical protein
MLKDQQQAVGAGEGGWVGGLVQGRSRRVEFEVALHIRHALHVALFVLAVVWA